MKHFKYLSYLIRHKWFVFVECCKLGIPWQGIVHDLSKFLPSEWFPYVETFYGSGENKEEFKLAWLKHQRRNPHHWQWWMLYQDSGKLKVLDMPDKLRREMLADWRGAGKAQGYREKDECKKWYLKNQYSMNLHPNTRRWIEQQLDVSN